MNFLSPSALRRTAALAAALALAGCATLGGTPEQIVAQRAGEYWKARQSGDYAKAYAFTTPSYRKLHSVEQYRLQFGQGATIQGAEVVKVDCETEKCTARIKINAAPALVGVNVGTIATHLSETWLLQDGQWWLHQDL
ncbi:MAG: hypothetical protein J0H16_22685 [Alicycliphilus denitrificans]|nr:hypothetical protein [Alicycliphilus denitrificans]